MGGGEPRGDDEPGPALIMVNYKVQIFFLHSTAISGTVAVYGLLSRELRCPALTSHVLVQAEPRYVEEALGKNYCQDLCGWGRHRDLPTRLLSS
eukprot:1371558-Rhodomonas_salina.1